MEESQQHQTDAPCSTEYEFGEKMDLRVTLSVSVISMFCASFMLVSVLSKTKHKLVLKLIALVAFGDFGWALTNVVYDLFLIFYGKTPFVVDFIFIFPKDEF